MRLLAFIFFVAALGLAAFTFRENESLKTKNEELTKEVADLKAELEKKTANTTAPAQFVPQASALTSPNGSLTVAPPPAAHTPTPPARTGSWMWNSKESLSPLEAHKNKK